MVVFCFLRQCQKGSAQMSLKILIIDDDPSDRAIFKGHLKSGSEDVEIIEATTAKEGLELIATHENINCVFLDYRLPDMDGIDVLKETYDSQADLGKFPTVLLTGQGSESVAVAAIRSGAQDYLIKNHVSQDTLFIAMAKAREIFELKKSRNAAIAMLEHSQKMDAVGKLTGGIAHDFNNLLTIIFGNTRLLEDMLKQDNIDTQACISRVETLQKTSKRGADLVKRLMVFSRQRSLDPVTVNVNELLEELQDLLRRSLGEEIEIKTNFSADVYNIDVDPSQLEHAVINMGVNARDEMPDGGDFTLSTKNFTFDADQAGFLSVDPGDYVCLTVSDMGGGISAEIVEKIFDPFFTTKDVGKGTGLGLSMVYGFVKDSGGAIQVESQKGIGTDFHLYFPRSLSEQERPLEESKNKTARVRGTGTILLVEDEPEIREMSVALLRAQGFEVIEAQNGIKALEKLKETNKKIDLIFTDIVMPGGMNGIQMAARAQTIQPEAKLLFTSGYTGEATEQVDLKLVKDYPLLNKPYDPEALLTAISDIFENKK